VHEAVLRKNPAACVFEKGQHGLVMDDDARPGQHLQRTLVDLLDVVPCEGRQKT
jgi:hypothetical protein